MTLVHGEKIKGRWGEWYQHTKVLDDKGVEVGTIQTRRRYYGKRIGHRVEVITLGRGGGCVLGSNPQWLTTEQSQRDLSQSGVTSNE